MRFSPGCRCCGCNFVIRVLGCSGTAGGAGGVNALSGISVSIGGPASASGTTGGDGKVTFNVVAGTYTVSVAAASGFAAYSASIAHACPEADHSITLSADSDHVCTSCCVYPIPKALNATYGSDSFAPAYNSAASGGGVWIWDGSGTQTVPTTANPGAGTFDPCVYTGTSVNVAYRLKCDAGSWSFAMTWKNCFCNDPPFGTPGFTSHSYPTNGTSGHGMHCSDAASPTVPCSPFYQQFSLPTNGASDVAGVDDSEPTPGGGGVGNPVTVTA